METDEENYRAFYKERRREKYIIEEAIKNGVVSFDALDKARQVTVPHKQQDARRSR